MRTLPWLILLVLLMLGSRTTALWAAETHNPAGETDYSDLYSDYGDEQESAPLIADPIEPFNRGMFWFNDKLYFYFWKPVARGYRTVVPEPARVGVGNFFSNLWTPIRAVNALLQFKVEDAARELVRFTINSTIGFGGLLDPAGKHAGLPKKEEDFGQTLGRYGVGPGFYIVLPVLGPSDVRDGLGRIPDYYLDPLTYMLNTYEGWGARGVNTVNYLSLDKDTYEAIKRESLDPYITIRDAYIQRREALIKK